jgi:hypothetical protein
VGAGEGSAEGAGDVVGENVGDDVGRVKHDFVMPFEPSPSGHVSQLDPL